MEEKNFEVRDKRAKDRFYLDDQYLNGYAKKCGIYATGVYVSLCRHSNLEQKCWPSIKKIAEELNISQTQTRRAIKILEEYKIIKKEQLGKKLNNRYWLLNKSEWSDRTLTDSPDRTPTTSPQDTHPLPDRTLHSKETHSKETHSKEIPYSPSFLEFWNIYPNKKGKGFAWNIWKRLKISSELKDTIIKALQNHIDHEKNWKVEGGKFIPHPSTWLNQRRWEDEIKVVEVKTYKY